MTTSPTPASPLHGEDRAAGDVPAAAAPRTAGLPPGPRLPALAQTALWIGRPVETFTACRRRYGDPFTLRLAGLPPLVFTSDPEAVGRAFRDNGGDLHAGEGNTPLKAILGPNSLLLLDGPPHMRQRRMLLPLFHGERMRAYGEAIRSIAVDASGSWRPETTLTVHGTMQSISMRVITHAVFGMEDEARAEECVRVLTRFMACLSGSLVYLPALQHELGGYGPWARFRRAYRSLADLLDDEIAHRREHADLAAREDILSLLLASRDEDGSPLAADLVRDQLITLLAAGHETTATALVWAFQHILSNPEVEHRLVAELDAAGDASPETIAAAPYLEAVCRETLRLFPVVPVIGRTVQTRYRLGDYDLPAGTMLIPCIYLIHRRPDLYPEPDRFLPERFLDRTPGPSEYLPFGGGIRRCIGANFALYEMKLVLATFLGRFSLALARPALARARRRHVTLYPRREVRVRVLASR